MLFMVVERFRNRDTKAVYARLEAQGRGLPDGLVYLDSWIEANHARCFQLVECEDPSLLYQWVAEWGDLVDFEFHPVVASKTARQIAGGSS